MSAKVKEANKVGFGEKLAYGVGDAANNVIWTSVGTFMLFFFTNQAGMSAAVAGVILLLARVLDAVVDLFVGGLVDRTRTRWGKARPWILWMAIPFGLFTVALFSVPNLGITGKIIYYSIIYLIVNIIYSCVNIPYGTLTSLISAKQNDRQVLSIFRMLSALVMGVLVNSSTTSIVKGFGNDAAAWQKTFIIFAAIAVVLYLTTFLGTKERVKIETKTVEGGTVSTSNCVKAMLSNKYMWMIFFFAIIVFLLNGLVSVNIYYCQYIFGDATKMMTLTLVGMVPMIPVLFIVPALVKKFGKRNIVLFGLFGSTLGYIITALAPENFTIVLIASLVKGLSMAPLVGCVFPMVFDTIEYGEWKTGIRTEALTYSTNSVASKIGTGGGSAIMGWVLAAGAFDATKAFQQASAIASIKIGFIWLPLALMVIGIVIMFIYDLDKIYPQIMADLNAKRGITAE